jgi:hypothetical protein
VLYPFPWLCLGIIFFICIAISEIVTKTVSRFKESFIALIALPELGAWLTYTTFLFITIGYKNITYANPFNSEKTRISAGLACLSLLTYVLINFSHALVHPRKMVPNTAETYKTMM